MQHPRLVLTLFLMLFVANFSCSNQSKKKSAPNSSTIICCIEDQLVERELSNEPDAAYPCPFPATYISCPDGSCKNDRIVNLDDGLAKSIHAVCDATDAGTD
ncbi:MAG: hypothetical protein IPJ88_18125 [Myxococcales bacterium]|nr:MAG: hypothetical protein IPJ88_18125 [Myxococcales bacterium]